MSGDVALAVKVALSRASADGATFTVDVDLVVPPGITILFGASGSGKSTILASVAGLTRPDRGRIALGGEVWFDGETGAAMPVHLRKVAYVFQSLALFPHMTAVANVAYGIASGTKAERRERAMESLRRFRVDHLAERRPRTFSGGEAQRVALARALAMAPRVILLDEPFSAMDRDLRRELAHEVRKLADAVPVPILHVTHHRNEARAMGDRAVLLARGRVVREGNLGDVIPDEGDAGEP